VYNFLGGFGILNFLGFFRFDVFFGIFWQTAFLHIVPISIQYHYFSKCKQSSLFIDRQIFTTNILQKIKSYYQ